MSHATSTKESRLLKAAAYDTYGSPVPPLPPSPNSEPQFTLTFTKSDADALMSCLDVTLKTAGLPACQAVTLWAEKVRDAMRVVT